MTSFWLILGMFAIVYTLRISGLLAHGLRLPETWERALGFAPVAVLSALVVSSLAGQASGEPIRLVAAAGAGVVMLITGRMWACILGGFVLYLALRLAVP